MSSAAMGTFGNLSCVSVLDGLLNFLKVYVRQRDLKAGNLAVCKREGSEADRAAIFLNDPFADPKTQPGALGGLCGEERFEEVLCVFWLDACARIADGDTN